MSTREDLSNGRQARPTEYQIPLWFYAFVPSRLAGGLIAPLTPLFIVQIIGGDLTDVGWVASVTSLASGPTSILWANLSDRMKTRLPFILIGLIAYGLTTFLTGLASTMPAVLIYSAVGALIGTALGPATSALLIENIPEKQWPVSFGWFNQIGGLSYVAGMVIATLWLQFLPDSFGNETVMRGLYLFSGGMSLTSPLLAFVWIKEPRKEPFTARRERLAPAQLGPLTIRIVERMLYHITAPFRFFTRPAYNNLASLLSSSLGKYYLYSFILFFGINVAFMPFPVFLNQELGASNSQVFLINLVKSVVDTFFYVPMGRWMVHRRGLGLQAQAAGIRAVLFAICALLALFNGGSLGLYIIILVQVFNGVTWAAISVSGPTAVADLSVQGTEARSMATYNAVLGFAGIIGNLAAGYIVESLGYEVSFSTAAVIMVITGILLWQLRKQPSDRQKNKTDQEEQSS